MVSSSRAADPVIAHFVWPPITFQKTFHEGEHTSGNEVTDDLLANAFRKYSSFQKAKVIFDKPGAH